MKNHRTSVLGLIAVVLLTGMAAAQNSVTPVPQCGNPQIENDTLFIVNPCSFPVNVTFTSLGDVWGGMPIGPGQHARTGYSGEAVNRVGEVHVYTCPGYGTPVQPDGSAIISGYTGRVYGCHGSGQNQSGLNLNPQVGQTPQQQVQQSLSSPAPANPWNRVVITPAGSDGGVQQSNNVQQATDDDDDEAQDTDADNDSTEADQSAALQQEYQMMRQNLNAAMQEAARNQVRSGSRVQPSQCVGERCY
jgi:hypothetical protein